MSDLAIRVRGLSKRYRLGQLSSVGRTFREMIHDRVGAVAGWFKAGKSGNGHLADEHPDTDNELWALKGIDFDVQRGEVLGIIGHNGAGKSTLLKILSRITDPTEGSAEIYGRVGSLLEVGTGFHPELTGRENVFLNGAILGMTHAEIKRKFDEIVAFAEIDKFMDTPAKRYSSGMYVRLAFAVAAHLEPEILIVDEVLAVGDAKFQAKCLGKMQNVASSGRTVLFVSHNMGAVQTLCGRGIVLSHGRKIADAPVQQAVASYLTQLEQAANVDVAQRTDRTGRGRLRVTRIEVAADTEIPTPAVACGGPARVTIHFNQCARNVVCWLHLFDNTGQQVCVMHNHYHTAGDHTDPTLDNKIICRIPELVIAPGRYRLDIEVLRERVVEDHVAAAAYIRVDPGQVRGRAVKGPSRFGALVLPHHWTLPE